MKLYKFIALSALLAAGVTSCSLTEEPTSVYEKDSFYQNAEQAKLAVTGIYDIFSTENHYGQYEMAMPCSDDTYYIQGPGTDNTRRDIAHYMVKINNQWVSTLWEYKYAGIDRANSAIDGIEKMAGFEENAVLKDYAAQARFLRAFLSFDLVKYWGDVPYKTNFSSGYDDAFGSRVSREEIYDYIIADLNYAKNNLTNTAGVNPEVPTQGAAHALLMRVYLQRAGYSLQQDGQLTRPDETTRKKYFEAVIAEWTAMKAKGGHNFDLSNSYKQYFVDNSAMTGKSIESLWEIAFNPTGQGYKDNSGQWGAYNGPLVGDPKDANNPTEIMGRANAFFRVLPTWKNYFEDTDERRDVMVCTYEYKWDAKKGVHTKTECKDQFKWCPGKWRREWMPLGYVDPNKTGVNYCPLRYSDAVLMAAEAYNETGDTPEAWTLLNSVRSRAKATPITSANYASLLKAPKVLDLPYINDADEAGKFRTALYWERAFELAFEGQRKYDLIRWGILPESLKLFQKENDKVSYEKEEKDKETGEIIKVTTVYPIKGKYIAGGNFITGKHELFPIPLDEIQANPKLENKNNPGYE